jgi:hypothetical protein
MSMLQLLQRDYRYVAVPCTGDPVGDVEFLMETETGNGKRPKTTRLPWIGAIFEFASGIQNNGFLVGKEVRE